MMMKYTLVSLLLISQLTNGEIVTKNDHFIGHGEQIFQKMVDDDGQQWQRPVSPMKLELLCNDKILSSEKQTCRDILKMFKKDNDDRVNKTVFQEMAEVSCD